VEILERLVEERALLPLARPEADGERRIRALTSFLALSRRLGRDRDHLPLGPAEELMEMARTWDPRRDGGQIDPDEDEALTLMTVHASKGLEFPVVILAEADNPPRFRADQVVVSRAGQLALRFKNPIGASIYPSDFTAIEAEEKALEARENGRLFYVAATRARDHLVLLGWPKPRKEEEATRETAEPADKAVAWLEALLNCPEASALTSVLEYSADPDQASATASTSATAGPELGDPPNTLLLAPMSLDSQTLAVTAFCRLLADPEAYCRENILGLDHRSEADSEFPRGSAEAMAQPEAGEAIGPVPGRATPTEISCGGASSHSGHGIRLEPGPDRPSGRLAPDQAGTLFHAVLEAVNPRSPQLEDLIQSQSARLGLAPGPAESADLAVRVKTFLNGPLGLAWRASPADYRELPFRLQLPGPGQRGRLTLTGVIDLFFLTAEGEGRIVDYKLAVGRPGPELAAYEHQLRIYGQALVSAGFKGRLQAALYFAGGAEPYIHQVELVQTWPLEPLWPLIEENFQFLLKARPLRPNRPAALNIV